MTSQDAHSPPSTAGSTAGSPPASLPPPTPLTPETGNFSALPTAVDSDAATSPSVSGGAPGSKANSKRKTSRRANTAERRATHNAVERQRRETLNGRFLDLAALLPNLASVRRPSKSAIVNSSIAIIHSSRRTRLLAARELRLLRAEGEALRREVNEWRARANLPRLEEPPRSAEFLNLINPQDIEGVNRMGVDGIGAGEWWDAEGLGEMGEEERKAYELSMQDEDDGTGDDGDDEMIHMGANVKGAAAPAAVQSAAMLNQIQMQQQQQQQVAPQSFSRGLAFDGMPSHPALSAGVHTMYEPSGLPHGASHALPVHPDFGSQVHHQIGNDKLGGAWSNPSLLLAQQQAQQWPSFAPMHNSVSINGPSPIASNGYYLQQQQQQSVHAQQMYGSPDMDDASSVSSGRAGSVGGSPGPYDMSASVNAGTTYGRRPSLSLNLNGTTWNTQQQQPLATGGGGTRHINALMAAMI